MDYIGNKCPVCDKYFHANEDIVVCPECGTPHHRECYNEKSNCFYADKHKDGFDYQQNIKEDTLNGDENLIVCKNCGAKNVDSAFFCSKCSSVLHETDNNLQNAHDRQNPNYGTSTFGTPHSGTNPNVIMFDPLAGVSPSADLGDGITAGETAKFVKQNTPYFITVFSNIFRYNKSRFNFCAMFFGGGYLLFRKMYKVGGIITAIQAAMTILYFYLDYYIISNNAYDKLLEASTKNDYNATMLYLSQLPQTELLMLFLFMMLVFMLFIMSVVIGGCANRMYYNHTKKQILKIKTSDDDTKNRSELFTKKGGVNIPLAISLWVSYLVLSYLPVFFY
ncbi:MAG: DUF2628 domain-containing protein [Ruminococcus sp.]|nr:DUF2628 domain-containing protein [Ruminococcus sp.]